MDGKTGSVGKPIATAHPARFNGFVKCVPACSALPVALGVTPVEMAGSSTDDRCFNARAPRVGRAGFHSSDGLMPDGAHTVSCTDDDNGGGIATPEPPEPPRGPLPVFAVSVVSAVPRLHSLS